MAFLRCCLKAVGRRRFQSRRREGLRGAPSQAPLGWQPATLTNLECRRRRWWPSTPPPQPPRRWRSRHGADLRMRGRKVAWKKHSLMTVAAEGVRKREPPRLQLWRCPPPHRVLVTRWCLGHCPQRPEGAAASGGGRWVRAVAEGSGSGRVCGGADRQLLRTPPAPPYSASARQGLVLRLCRHQR